MAAAKKANSSGKPGGASSSKSGGDKPGDGNSGGGKQSGGPFGSSFKLVAVAIVAILAVAAWEGVNLYRARQARIASTAAAQQAANDLAHHLRITLDPNLYAGEVKQAYQVAGRDPALLAQMHCYCGCDRTNGHKNLLDCFRDEHGSHCAICTGEALEAEKLAEQGMPIEKIRDSLRERFANGE